MIELLPDLPADTVGIRASGQVDSADYETVLVPAVESVLKEHGKVRLLYQIGNDFTGFTAGAMWDDMRLGLAHLGAWEKVAVVTDVGWVAHAASLFRFAMPFPLRVFPLEDRAAAEAWLASGPPS